MDQSKDHREQLDYELTEAQGLIAEEEMKHDTIPHGAKKYRKVLNLFKFHSWLPLYVNYLDPELTLNPEHLPVSLGISLVSQNLLSTAISQVGYEYRNGTHMFHSGIKLSGRYPVLNMYLDYGGEPDVLLLREEGDTAMSLPQALSFTAQSYIPLRFNTGKFLSIIQPGITYSYQRDLQYIEEKDIYRTGAHYLFYTLYGSFYLRKGKKEILPRMGLTASGGYYHAPFDNRVYGSVYTTAVTGYLPGFMKHQTIRLTFNYQKQLPLDRTRPAFINLMDPPRGLHHIFGEVFSKFSVDYVFPILYPDVEISSVIYLKRLRGALWADYLTGENVIIREPSPHYEQKDYSTWGFDMIADLNLFRIPFPLSVGGRMISDRQSGRILFHWIYSIEFN